jgi:AcrR family transcriptional regulator
MSPMRSPKSKALRWERRPDERPQELLQAALRVFAEQGYSNARLEEVAAAAGVTKGAVYHYFSNKEELLQRALEHYQALAFGRVEDALRAETGPASARLGAALRALFGSPTSGRRDVLLLLQSVVYEVPDLYRRWVATGPMKAWEVVADLIEDGKLRGEFRSDVDSDVAARIFLSGLLVQLMWQPLSADIPGLAIDPDHLLDSAIALLVAGLQPVVHEAKSPFPPRTREP